MFDVSVKWDFEEPDKTIKGIMEKRAAAVTRARCPEHGGTPKNVTLRKVEGEYEVSFDPDMGVRLYGRNTVETHAEI